MEASYLNQFEEFLETYYKKDLEKIAEIFPGKKSLEIDYKKLDAFDIDLADELIQKPYTIIQAAKDAVSGMSILTADGVKFLPNIRFFNLPLENRVLVRNINSTYINKFLSVEGVVTKITDVKPKIIQAVFECRNCGRIYNIPQTGRGLTEPLICACERKNFELLEDQSVFIDTQKAEIQEPLELLRGGEQTKKMILWIEDDLTNKLVPGDKVEITGVLRLQTPKYRGAIYDKFIDVNNLTKLEKEFEEIELSDEDKKKINELSKDPKLYEKIVASIAPSIYGHDEIKEAIALQLFGGTPGKVKPDGMRIRPESHILLIGDPGCLVADERIVLGDGTITKIGELGKEHLEKIDCQVLTGQGYKRDKATVFHIYKNQPIIEVVTETGKSIKGTYNHPLLVVKNRSRHWKRLDEILQGDKVATVPWIPCTITASVKTGWSKTINKYGPKSKSKLPSQVIPSLAGLMGYILGDGWVRKHKVCFLVAPDELDILPALVSFVEENFNIKPSVRITKPRKGRTVALTEVDVNDRDVANCFSFLKEKRIPDLIMKSGNKTVAEFISWLFEADGCVFCKGRGRRAVQFKSASIELLRDIQMLLLRFRIHSRIVGRNLTIRQSLAIQNFAKCIGFKSKKKKLKLKELVKYCKKLEKVRRRKLSEKVVSVKKIGYSDVFDIEVPSSHRFIANGIISHNTAKTQLLRYVKDLAPKGLYVSGKASTAAGLTASAEKDELAEGGWTLKAGALVLAAGGMAMIDEFDKMSEQDRASMHEAMESASISVAKAGMVTTFKANTSILAASNPKYGRFDPYSLPAEQFDIPPTLLSRFDLIFPVRDVLDSRKDREMAEHILTSHYIAGVISTKEYDRKAITKMEKKVVPIIEPSLMRKYIAFARKEIHPVLTKEAMEKVKAFYLDLRMVGEKQKSIPITARYLEAVIRLAEASAKGRLSNAVEIEDAERAIKLLKFCLREVGIDPETGKFDIDILATGSSKSRMDKLRTVFRIIKKLSEEFEEVQHDAVFEEAKAQGIKPEELEELLQTLKRNGDIYSPKYGVYKPAEER